MNRSQYAVRRRGRAAIYFCARRSDLVQEHVEVAETQLFPEVSVQLAVVATLVLARLLGVGVALMDKEVVGEDVVGDARQVQLEQAGCLVAAVADESLVAPASDSSVSASRGSAI